MPTRPFLAIDIETNKTFPMGEDWRSAAPLGIACATAYADNKYWVWAENDSNGAYKDQLSVEAAQELVHDLQTLAQEYTIVTWNGAGFDWPIIAQESNELEACKELALNHVDMMLQLMCVKGYPVSLASACTTMGMPSKTEGVNGSMVNEMWANGQREQIIQYCIQDSYITATLANMCQRMNNLQWTSKRGTLQTLMLPDGWLSVENALQLPLPDTSWMTEPLTRQSFVNWLLQQNE